MSKNDAYLLGLDTMCVLAGDYNRRDILGGFNDRDVSTPLFDSLAADRFASDRPVNPFNLGDYR